MTHNEPSRAWQDAIHKRILQEDAVAFAELCESALPFLVAFLEANFPNDESHLHETAAIDCLLSYQSKAEQYDARKLTLFGYLRMAARRDMLNAISKELRRTGRLADLDNPAVEKTLPQEDSVEDQQEITEHFEARAGQSAPELLERLDRELDEQEQKVLRLMLAGERNFQSYVQVLDIRQMKEPDQRRAVKRAKDRVSKKLRRYGGRIDNM